MATAQISHRQSNRFCPPAQRRPFHHRAQGMGLTHGGEMFAEGGWSAIKIRLEARGWSAHQIELFHIHLRQGWPLAMAARQVALATGLCPLRSRPMG